MTLKCGIIGLPNVGKSTLFNALTHAQVATENYPFCTIDPNLGTVPLPDPRLNKLVEMTKPQKVIPATVQFVDIAGLVAGASKGEGLGNQFLAHIREVDAITHVVRCFENGDVIHVAGRVDPLSDMDTINTELALADMQTIEKQISRQEKITKSGDKEAAQLLAILKRTQSALDQGVPVRSAKLSFEEQKLLNSLFLLTQKPVMYLANVSEKGADNNPLLEAVQKRAVEEGAAIVPICAGLEAQIAGLDAEEQEIFLADLGMREPGLSRVVRSAAKLLGLQTYFTVGPKEVRAWTFPAGATAPQAAGVIHTDFERGFIRAEVMSYQDFVDCGGEQGAKEAGKLRVEGKEYVVKDGDVLHFRFNV